MATANRFWSFMWSPRFYGLGVLTRAAQAAFGSSGGPKADPRRTYVEGWKDTVDVVKEMPSKAEFPNGFWIEEYGTDSGDHFIFQWRLLGIAGTGDSEFVAVWSGATSNGFYSGNWEGPGDQQAMLKLLVDRQRSLVRKIEKWDGSDVNIEVAMPTLKDFPGGWKDPGHPNTDASHDYRFVSLVLTLNSPSDCGGSGSLVAVFDGSNAYGESVTGWQCIPDAAPGIPDYNEAQKVIAEQLKKLAD